MPVYNGENFITEAIDSILAQTFSDFELIISDNASTDKTEELCRMYAERDQRIWYYRNDQNMGAAWNINRLVDLARGEYFKWAHYDDICRPEFLERCLTVLEQEPLVILCYPRTHIIDNQSRITDSYADNLNLDSVSPHERFRVFLNNPGLCTAAHGLMRLSELKQTGRMGDFAIADRNLLGELALRGQFRELPEYLFLYRSHPQSSNNVYRDQYQLMAFYNPQKRNRLLFPRWRRFFEYFKAMKRTRLNWHEWTRCTLLLARYLLIPRRAGGLLKEIIIAGRVVLYKVLHQFQT